MTQNSNENERLAFHDLRVGLKFLEDCLTVVVKVWQDLSLPDKLSVIEAVWFSLFIFMFSATLIGFMAGTLVPFFIESGALLILRLAFNLFKVKLTLAEKTP